MKDLLMKGKMMQKEQPGALWAQIGRAETKGWVLREVYFDEDGNPTMHREPAPQQKPLTDEPDWRHPKIQGLIGSEARLRITIDLIWQILENPEQEFTASDMEYWDTIHDKLKESLSVARAIEAAHNIGEKK